MSEIALDHKGELGRYSTRPKQKLTRQCERMSGIIHPLIAQDGYFEYPKHMFKAIGKKTITILL